MAKQKRAMESAWDIVDELGRIRAKQEFLAEAVQLTLSHTRPVPGNAIIEGTYYILEDIADEIGTLSGNLERFLSAANIKHAA